jgi:hypothetical protein
MYARCRIEDLWPNISIAKIIQIPTRETTTAKVQPAKKLDVRDMSTFAMGTITIALRIASTM